LFVEGLMSCLRYLCLLVEVLMSCLHHLCLFVEVLMSCLHHLCLFVEVLMSCLHHLCLFVEVLMSCLLIVLCNTYCVVFLFFLRLVYPILPISLDCPLLIAPLDVL
jgi:hypothetical protein